MSKLAFIATRDGISAVIDGETLTITSDNPSYKQVLDAIKSRQEPAQIAELFRTANAVRSYMASGTDTVATGKVEVINGEVRYQGETLHNIVVDRILQFMTDGLPADPLLRFLENLLQNPSRRSVEELYKFLENGSMPITEEGNIIAYKGVNEDYTDCHTGKFDNHPGKENSMQRRDVDDDFRRDCSNGFHVGSVRYATGFGQRTVLVEVNPADVVSVPENDCEKMRCCRYKVIADYAGAIKRPLASVSAPYDDRSEVDKALEDDDYLGGW